MKRNFKRIGAAMIMALTVSAMLSACGQKEAKETPSASDTAAETGSPVGAETGGGEEGVDASAKKDILNIGISAEPSTLDPHLQSGQATRLIKQQIYRGLMTYTADSAIEEDAAESYKVSDDGLVYTFVLKEVKFHDGSPVTAEDVKFSLDRIMDDTVAATFGSDFRSTVAQVEAVDDKTVNIILKQPCAPFLEYLCLPEAAIVSKAFCEQNNNDLSITALGCGPYMFDEWEKGLSITVKAFDGWYGDPVQTPNIDFYFYTDETTRANALRTGEVDIIDYVPSKEAIAFEAAGDAKVDVSVAPFMCLQVNCKEGSPLADPKVRQAIAYAINREDVINAAFMGRGEAIYGFPTIVGQNGYEGKYDDYFSFNPEKAKELLAEAGYPDGFSCKLLSSSTYAFHEQTAVCVQSSLADIGIKVELELPDWATRIERSNVGDYDLMVSGTTGNIVDMDWTTNYYKSGDVRMNSCPGFADATVDGLLEKGRTSLDEKERIAVYDEFRERALEQSPFIFINFREQVFAVNDKVQGFKNLDGILTYLSGLTLQDTYVEE